LSADTISAFNKGEAEEEGVEMMRRRRMRRREG